LIAARSGRVIVANAWKVIFEVPEIRIASSVLLCRPATFLLP